MSPPSCAQTRGSVAFHSCMRRGKSTKNNATGEGASPAKGFDFVGGLFNDSDVRIVHAIFILVFFLTD